jgi:hypothetical protein
VRFQVRVESVALCVPRALMVNVFFSMPAASKVMVVLGWLAAK